jgi:hypothetical protein
MISNAAAATHEHVRGAHRQSFTAALATPSQGLDGAVLQTGQFVVRGDRNLVSIRVER